MTLQISSAIQWAIVFLETHLIYWIMFGALVFECRYLFHKNRREVIAMSRLGEASRREHPAFFYFLWVLHILGAAFFTLMFVGYLLRL